MLRRSFKPLVQISELSALLSHPQASQNLKIVNTNYATQLPSYTAYNPPAKSDHIFLQKRLPFARHIDLVNIGDKSQGLPAMLPKQENFRELMKELDIGINDHVLCYGDDNLVGPCRAFWMFRVFGIPNVSILNGPISLWQNYGGKIEEGDQTWKATTKPRDPKDFEFTINKDLVTEMAEIQRSIEAKKSDLQLIDTRKKNAYQGESNDPKGTRTGHIPTFRNLPFVDLLKEDGSFKSEEELNRILRERNFSFDTPTIVSCNSGMTASVVYYAMNLVGKHRKLSLYDGSWSEWSKHEQNPVAKGA